MGGGRKRSGVKSKFSQHVAKTCMEHRFLCSQGRSELCVRCGCCVFAEFLLSVEWELRVVLMNFGALSWTSSVAPCQDP